MTTVVAPAAAPDRVPLATCALIGLGGLFAGVTGPLLSTFLPLLVREALGERRTAIGAVMTLDNLLLLLLVPVAGAISDRRAARGAGRLPPVLVALVLAAAGMAMLPWAARFGLGGLILGMVLLYSGINLQRSPVQAMLADLLPSRYRSLGTASVTFQMCVGAIVFLMLGRLLGMAPALLIAAVSVLGIAAAFARWLREPRRGGTAATEATYRDMWTALVLALRGGVPGLRAVFVATLLLQLTFQTFSTWFALHGTERFGVRPADVALGFIAWALGGVIGALPAGLIGTRLGRRRTMLVGYAGMAIALLALHRATTLGQAVPLLALASACWTLPSVNAYPLFIEPIPPHRRGVLSSLFLLCMALGGGIGDPLNGIVFDAADSYRGLFLVMAGYTALAFVAVLAVPHGAGEADTAPATTATTDAPPATLAPARALD